MWSKKNKWMIIISILIVALLVGAFCFGGNAPDSKGGSTEETPSSMTDGQTEAQQPTEEENQDSTQTQTPDETTSMEPAADINPETSKDQYLTTPATDGRPLPVEPQAVVIGNTAYSCTISISCATVLDNTELCDPEKLQLVPEDGWILRPATTTFYEGESVFNVLRRVCKQNSIHMEFQNTPLYNSAYIEGISNLYEFDVGELSGWMYNVNGWFPNYGCSRYKLNDGDVICFVYTCDLGYDVGGGYATGN